MALPSTGAISLSAIQTEFGGANPISLSEYYAGGAYVPSGTTGTQGAVPSSGAISLNQFHGTTAIVVGQAAYTTAGTYTWVAPAGVTSVSVVTVGAGSGFPAGGGGALGYKNNYAVTPGSSYTLQVGAPNTTGNPGVLASSVSYFVSAGIVSGEGGKYYGSAAYVGDGGGAGGYAPGQGSCLLSGGGGAGGYSGVGGFGRFGGTCGNSGGDGVGGAGGGGANGNARGGNGGGVGLLGQGSNGAGGVYDGGNGGAGSGGSGTSYGGALGQGNSGAGSGAVRIIWPGNTRSFPSTNTGNM